MPQQESDPRPEIALSTVMPVPLRQLSEIDPALSDESAGDAFPDGNSRARRGLCRRGRRAAQGRRAGRSTRDTVGRGGVQLPDVDVVGAQRCADFDAGPAVALSPSRSWTTTTSTARDGDTDRTRWGVFASK